MSAARNFGGWGRAAVAGLPALFAVMVLLACTASVARAEGVTFVGSSSDGAKAFFTTREPIRPAGDVDRENDLYQRSAGVTSLLSFGPLGGNGPFDIRYEGAAANGSHVFFSTSERLVAADTDSSQDVYDRTLGVTVLVSTGPGAPGDIPAEFSAASADGSRVIFSTTEKLDAADTDSGRDIYERENGMTTLLSGTGTSTATFGKASDDASRVLFVTVDRLVPGDDTDSQNDIYVNANGSISLVSPGTEEIPTAFNTISADGTQVFFETEEQLTDEDQDAFGDIYHAGDGEISLVSTSADGGNGEYHAALRGNSADGSHAYFTTAESLVGEDTDSVTDIYERSGGTTQLISTGPLGGNAPSTLIYLAASADGSRVFFTTDEPLVAEDTDTAQDIYERFDNTTKLVSVGPTAGTPADPSLAAVSTDGTRVLFTTTEKLVAADGDSMSDVYERSGEQTTLISTGPNGGHGPDPAVLGGATQSLSVAFVQTAEHLTPDDDDAEGDVDVFARYPDSSVLLISMGGQVSNDPTAPRIDGFKPATRSPNSFPHVYGQAPAGSTVRIYLNTNVCTGIPAAGGAAAEFALSGGGIGVAVPENETTAIRASVTDLDGNPSPCSPVRFYEHDSLAPAPPANLATSPRSPANDNLPLVRGSVDGETEATVRIYTNGTCAGEPAKVGTQSTFTSSGLEVLVEDDTTTIFSAKVVDRAGNVSACTPTPISYIEDSKLPVAPVLAATSPKSPSSAMTVKVTGTAPGGTTVHFFGKANCAGPEIADGRPGVLADPGIEVEVPANETTVITALTKSPSGNRSACSEPLTYVMDSIAPATPRLSFASRARSSDNRVIVKALAGALTKVFLYRGRDCAGDPIIGTPQQLGTAGMTFTAANNTTITFRAIAQDAAHNRSACSEPMTYVEDSRAPRTRFTFGPAFKTRDRTPTFRFMDDTGDTSARYLCRLDRGKFRRCTSPRTFKGLRPGRHTISVRAIDGAGNREAKPVSRRFRVVR